MERRFSVFAFVSNAFMTGSALKAYVDGMIELVDLNRYMSFSITLIILMIIYEMAVWKYSQFDDAHKNSEQKMTE